jgi:hypothetical protein
MGKLHAINFEKRHHTYVDKGKMHFHACKVPGKKAQAPGKCENEIQTDQWMGIIACTTTQSVKSQTSDSKGLEAN